MASFNRVILMGNLTRDPEYKQLASGQAVCRLGLATNRQFKNKQTNSMVQEVCFIDVDVWGPQAESCKQYLQKGRGVLVEGRLKQDSWEDAQGQTRNKHSIVADRVVFMKENGATADVEMGMEMPEAAPVQAPASFQSAAPAPKTRKSVGAVSLKKEDLPEIDFKDEPPFQDDLPF